MRSGKLTRVGIYRRAVSAALERVWENVFDWEHLPWLHRGSFSAIACEDAGAWGWRARVGLQPAAQGREIRLELVVERNARRYVSRTLEGPGAGTEIWTRLTPAGPAVTGIEVAFDVPGVAPARAADVGARYTKLYTRLWDEDEAMMREREVQLAARRVPTAQGPRELVLGSSDEVRKRSPFCVELGGRSFRIVDLGGEILAHAAVCPHRLGPLDASPVEDGCVRCPWHGYRFDLRTGRSTDGRGLRLPRAPRVEIDGGWVVLTTGH